MILVLIALQISSGEVVTNHVRGVSYTRTEAESACGVHVIRVRYRNEWPRGIRGRIDSVRIDNVDVAGAAAELEARAANRSVSTIEIMNCGFDERNPTIQGVMVLAEPESFARGLPPRVFFRIQQQGGRWEISWD